MTSTTSTIGNLFLFASLGAGTTIALFPYEYDYNAFPKEKGSYAVNTNISDWSKNIFSPSTQYAFVDEDVEKINTIINFTKIMIENTKDMDAEFVDIVNDHFWDLV